MQIDVACIGYCLLREGRVREVDTEVASDLEIQLGLGLGLALG